MLNKVRYFLQQNKGREWSGPAWYSVEYQNLPGKKKYPLKITLEYFHPLHLGDGTSTDWDGDKLQEIWGKLRKQYPEIFKELYKEFHLDVVPGDTVDFMTIVFLVS